MALETATYINGLVPTNPAQGDLVSAGDDHLRLLKSTIRNTFPNITGAITASHTELNHMVGVTSGVQAQLNGKAANSHTHAETDIVDGNVFPESLVRRRSKVSGLLPCFQLLTPTPSSIPARPSLKRTSRMAQCSLDWLRMRRLRGTGILARPR